jgi:hypothetical protein
MPAPAPTDWFALETRSGLHQEKAATSLKCTPKLDWGLEAAHSGAAGLDAPGTQHY